MQSRKQELEDFKRQINLMEFAGSWGYEIDKDKSHKLTYSMKNHHGDRVLVSYKNTIWQYLSLNGDVKDKGSIIDFIQHRQPISLGEVRKLLRGFTSTAGNNCTLFKDDPVGSNDQFNREKIGITLKKLKILSGKNKYLQGRGLDITTFNHPLFAGRIMRGFNGAVVFPHHDYDGICGYEVKSEKLTSFSKGGRKSLWRSNIPPVLDTIIFVESPIEALSYFQLFVPPNAMLAATSGNWSEIVSKIIVDFLSNYNKCQIKASFNSDKGGVRHEEKLKLLADTANIKEFSIHRPATTGSDWNKTLAEIEKIDT